MEEKSQSKQRWLIPALLAVVILLLAVVLVFVLTRSGDSENSSSDGAPKLTYAAGVTVVDDENALQKAYEEMKAKEGTIALSYKNDALSSDGKVFSCYIANSPQNEYDMFINIYADSELKDQLYLSGLVRPGEAFEEIILDHALDEGTHRVFVVYTQVEDDLETLHAQVSVTMDFTVSK